MLTPEELPGLPFADPGFDEAAFLEQSRAAFYTVKRSWAQLKSDISRHVMGEDLWEAQKAQMEVFRLDGITVESTAMGPARTIGTDDRIEVHFAIGGHDYVIRDATREVVRGDPNETSWRENWTMQRSRDPQLVANAASTKCPECGSPLTLDEDGLCQFCHAVVPGAKTDWLVVDIARPSPAQGDSQAADAARTTVLEAMAADGAAHPWTGSGPAPLPIEGAEAGIKAIQAHDPAFAPGDFLADCRGLFIRLDEARNEVAPEMVRALVADDFYSGELKRAAEVRTAGQNEVDAFMEVVGVSLVSAGSREGKDQVTARVEATSARHLIDVHQGTMIGGDNTVTRWHSDMYFERARTVTSDPLRGVAAGLCPSCQAVDSIGADGSCGACGRHVTGGEYDWVLVREDRQAS